MKRLLLAAAILCSTALAAQNTVSLEVSFDFGTAEDNGSYIEYTDASASTAYWYPGEGERIEILSGSDVRIHLDYRLTEASLMTLEGLGFNERTFDPSKEYYCSNVTGWTIQKYGSRLRFRLDPYWMP